MGSTVAVSGASGTAISGSWVGPPTTRPAVTCRAATFDSVACGSAMCRSVTCGTPAFGSVTDGAAA